MGRKKKTTKTPPPSPPPPSPSKDDYNVAAEEFIIAWQSAESLEEVSAVTGIPKPICSARASKYRGDGIRLKRMPRKSSRALDVDYLNRLIEKVNKQLDIESTNDEVKVPAKRKPLTKKEVKSIVTQVCEELKKDE